MSDWFIRWRENNPDHKKLGRLLATFFTLSFGLALAGSARIGGAVGLAVTVRFTVFAGVGLLVVLVRRAKA